MVRSALLRLLDEDPDLGAGLDPRRLEAAGREVLCEALDLQAGPLPAELGVAEPERSAGLLILDGLISRQVGFGERRSLELLGTGDLIRPWQDDGALSIVPARSAWRVLAPARLAVLDRAAMARVARWPELGVNLVARAMRRSDGLAGRLAVSQLPRVDDRLVVALWHLAERWGIVTPGGTVLDLPLSHEMLAALIGAQRPTVTLAVRQLTERGALLRRADRSWLLLGAPPEPERLEASRMCPGELGAAS